jgi:6-pyruvoyltetrahydropterin/6-carboxytetrahydropterin synthase
VYVLKKTFRFEAAHRLPHHDGKCKRLHGHSWIATVEVAGHALQLNGPAQGMVVDYGTISAAMRPLLDEYLDHHFLNETLDIENPTSEHVAEWLYDRLRVRLQGLVAVTVEETCTAACEYRP